MALSARLIAWRCSQVGPGAGSHNDTRPANWEVGARQVAWRVGRWTRPCTWRGGPPRESRSATVEHANPGGHRTALPRRQRTQDWKHCQGTA
eukprot:626358-Pyramimonas_sp.AAC.1